MQDHNGQEIGLGATVAIPATVTGLSETQVHATTASGAAITVAPTDIVQKPAAPVVEAPEEVPGAGGVGAQKPKAKK